MKPVHDTTPDATIEAATALPLAGVRVIDFTQALAGPFATMMLSDLGADVIKIEPPRGDDSRHWGPPFAGADSTYFMSVNRNKRSVTLDLKDPVDLARARQLVRGANVVAENWSTGTAARLGLGYVELAAENPSLVYCSISAFGVDQPHRVGYDQIVQGTSGVMTITGPPDEPTKWGVPVGDIAAGMFAVSGVLAAIFAQLRTGRGALVEVGMEDSLLAMLSHHAARQLVSPAPLTSSGNGHPTISPYGIYPTADGYVNVCVGNNAQFARMCHALEIDALIADARFATNSLRVSHSSEMTAALHVGTTRLRTAEVIVRLEAAGVPVGAVRTVQEAMQDPLVRARGMVLDMQRSDAEHVEVVNSPIRFDGAPASARLVPPLLGQHTDEVLAELALDGAVAAGSAPVA